MTVATSQTLFRAHMKDYMDSVLTEREPVYVVRGNDTFVLESQDKYKLMVDYINATDGSTKKALLEEKLIDAKILPQPKAFASARDMMKDILANGE